MGAFGAWRKISAYTQTYGFLYALRELIQATPHTRATLKVLDMMADLALHCPMVFFAFELQPDLEKNIYLKSFQLMEDFRKREEEQVPSGWEICCLWNQARNMVDTGQDFNGGLIEFVRGLTLPLPASTA